MTAHSASLPLFLLFLSLSLCLVFVYNMKATLSPRFATFGAASDAERVPLEYLWAAVSIGSRPGQAKPGQSDWRKSMLTHLAAAKRSWSSSLAGQVKVKKLISQQVINIKCKTPKRPSDLHIMRQGPSPPFSASLSLSLSVSPFSCLTCHLNCCSIRRDKQPCNNVASPKTAQLPTQQCIFCFLLEWRFDFRFRCDFIFAKLLPCFGLDPSDHASFAQMWFIVQNYSKQKLKNIQKQMENGKR